jgi:hypothetical protein
LDGLREPEGCADDGADADSCADLDALAHAQCHAVGRADTDAHGHACPDPD